MLGRTLRNAFEKRRKGKSKTSVVSVLAKPVLYSWTSCPCWDDPSIENLAYTASLCLGVSWERFVNPDYYIVPHRLTPIWQSLYNAISSPATWAAKGNWYGRCIHLLFAQRYRVCSAPASWTRSQRSWALGGLVGIPPIFQRRQTGKSRLQEPQIAAGKKAYLFFGNGIKTGQICLGCRYRLIPSASWGFVEPTVDGMRGYYGQGELNHV